MDERQAAPIAELLRRGNHRSEYLEEAPGSPPKVALGRFFFVDAALGRVRGHELHRGAGRRRQLGGRDVQDVDAALGRGRQHQYGAVRPVVLVLHVAADGLLDGVERVPPARLVLVRYELGRRRAFIGSESNASPTPELL